MNFTNYLYSDKELDKIVHPNPSKIKIVVTRNQTEFSINIYNILR